MRRNKAKELDRLRARVAVIEQKCDLLTAQVKSLRLERDIDELIERLHRHARSARNDLRR